MIMTFEASLRRARADDTNVIASIWHDSWHLSHAPDTDPDVVKWRNASWFLERATAAPLAAYLAVREEPVGFAAWSGDKLTHLFVAEREYGRGTSERLLAAVEAEILREGLNYCFLYCRKNNHRALRFYQKHGWVEESELTEQLICLGGTRPSVVLRLGKTL
jgi:GNAT superfamily N-acetyltransferase